MTSRSFMTSVHKLKQLLRPHVQKLPLTSAQAVTKYLTVPYCRVSEKHDATTELEWHFRVDIWASAGDLYVALLLMDHIS